MLEVLRATIPSTRRMSPPLIYIAQETGYIYEHHKKKKLP